MKKKQKDIIKEFEIAIIGGGVAGLYASFMGAYNNKRCIIIEQNKYLGGQPIDLYPTKNVYDFPTYDCINAKELVNKIISQVKLCKNNKIEINSKILDITVKHFDNEDYFYIQTTKKSYLTKYLILATGNGIFNPKKLEIKNKEVKANFIYYHYNMDLNIYQNQKLIILGGGDSAVELANYFVEQNISKNVTLIHRRNNFRSTLKAINDLTKNMVDLKLNYEIIKLDKKQKQLSILNNLTNKNETINFDYIFVLYGQNPYISEINLFNNIKKEKGKFCIDLNQKTNYKNVYAIGDATYFYCKPNTILNAVADGATAINHIVKNKDQNW